MVQQDTSQLPPSRENLDPIIEEILDGVFGNRPMVPLNEFAAKNDVTRIHLCREEKRGRIKITRLGNKVLVSRPDARVYYTEGRVAPKMEAA